jgi:hypothetical protein
MLTKSPSTKSHHQFVNSTWQQQLRNKKLDEKAKKVVHIALVEPMWVHKSPPSSIPMERDCSKNCCKKFQCLVEVLVRGQQELAMRKTWVINKMQCIIKRD